MDFELPADLVAYIAELDRFIEAEITPLEQADEAHRLMEGGGHVGKIALTLTPATA